jgi:DNA repair protein RecN (Recombination protein N)
VLRELSVQNLALIEDARVELHGGYCAWTGETGAGKSLILTALGLVLGGKAAAELVRAGKMEARAAAVFELSEPSLRADVEAILDGPIEDDELVLTRRVSASGKSQAHANGMPVAVSMLRRLGERLIDIHGQHEGRALLDADCQRDLLDAFGRLGRLVSTYRESREIHAVLRRKRQELLDAAHQRTRERALLLFERDELASADPRPGEYEELTRDAHRLANVEEIREATTEGYRRLYEADHSAQEILERVAQRLEPLGDSIPELATLARDLSRLADETREAALELRRLGDGEDVDAGRLEEIEARLAHYRRLASRFRCSPDDLASRREEAESRLNTIEQDESELESIDAPLVDAWSALRASAEELTAGRRKACKAFAKAVQSHFKDLNLSQAKISVEVEAMPLGDDATVAPPPEGGADRVEIQFAANVGEGPRPLRKIASGGELSRVMLAIKTVLAEVDRVPTLVFDEIDTGVGGRLGAVLGRKLAELARQRQVLCVTHLPQMASFAQHQWVIRKRSQKGRTLTTISPLCGDDRVDELAAMLRGDSAAEGTRREAMAMLVEAQSHQ